MTSLQQNFSALVGAAEEGTQVILVQETKCTEASQTLVASELRELGWEVVWGKPLPTWRSDHEAKPGGVAILVRKGIPHRWVEPQSDNERQLWGSSRWVRAKVALKDGSTWLDFTSLYCDVQDEEMREEQLMSAFESAAREGDAPCVIGGDFNTTAVDSATLSASLDTGIWLDAAKEYAVARDMEPDVTCVSTRRRKDGNLVQSQSRIDYVVLNRAAFLGLQQVQVLQVTGIPQHRPIEVKLQIDAYDQMVSRYRVPRGFPVDEAQKKLQRARDMWDSELHWGGSAGDPEAMWRRWNTWAEDFLCEACDDHLEGKQQAYRGRGECREPTEVRATTKTDRQTGDPLIIRQRRLLKCLAQLDECVVDAIRPKKQIELGQTPHDIARAWDHARGTMTSLADLHPPMEKPQLEELHVWRKKVRQKFDTLCRKVAEDRTRRWKHRLREAWENAPKAVFDFCKEVEYKKVTSLKRGDGTFTANHKESDELLREAWSPIFRRFQDQPEPTYEAFRERFEADIAGRGCEMKLSKLDGNDLRKTLRKMKTKTSAGIEGWRMAELKQLPTPLLDKLADVFDVVERTGKWPKSLMRALISLIPKGNGDGPLEQRPITVTSCVYRLWAATRLRSLIKWQESWVTDGQHGFRPHHGTDALYWKMALRVEKALLQGDARALWGFTIDFAKCFDRVPHEISLALATEWGAHDRIMRPLRAAYSTLERRFKIGGVGVGEPFRCTNGILQGCPLSVVLLNAIIAVWTHAIEREAGVKGEAYADDIYALHKDKVKVAQAAVITEDFITLTDMEAKPEKCAGFTTDKKGVTSFGLSHGVFPHKKSLKTLGADMVFQGRQKKETFCSRVKKATKVLKRIRKTPLRFAEKCKLVNSLAHSMMLYGCTVTDIPAYLERDTSLACVQSVWGEKRKQRSHTIVGQVLAPTVIDTKVAVPQMRFRTFLRLVKDRETHDLAREVWELNKLRVDNMTQGPMALLQRDFERLGWDWGSAFDMIGLRCGLRVHIDTFDAGRWGHEMREAQRAKYFTEVAKERKSMVGVERGIDREATNALWKDRGTDIYVAGVIRGNIAGATATGQHLAEKKIRITALCHYCEDSVETHMHMWWRCPKWAHLRRGAEDLVREARTWPACFARCGIVQKGWLTAVIGQEQRRVGIVSRVQRLMADIAIARFDEDKAGDKARKVAERERSGFPWGWTPPGPTVTLNPLERTVWSKYLKRRWAGDEGMFWAFREWLAALSWSDDTAVGITQLELALDFEAFSGLDLGESLSLKERADKMGVLLRQAGAAGNGREVRKGEDNRSIHTLKTFGAPPLAGFTSRPKLTMTQEVEDILRRVQASAKTRFLLKREATAKKEAAHVWGEDAVVEHAPGRAQRAEQWERKCAEWRDRVDECSARETSTELPVGDPVTVPDARRKVAGERACRQHQRVRCEDCIENKVEMLECCCAHHHPDEDVEERCAKVVDMCERHSKTACGACLRAGTSAAICCKRHHACVKHNRELCDKCKGKTGARRVQVEECCKKHHLKSGDRTLRGMWGLR